MKLRRKQPPKRGAFIAPLPGVFDPPTNVRVETDDGRVVPLDVVWEGVEGDASAWIEGNESARMRVWSVRVPVGLEPGKWELRMDKLPPYTILRVGVPL